MAAAKKKPMSGTDTGRMWAVPTESVPPKDHRTRKQIIDDMERAADARAERAYQEGRRAMELQFGGERAALNNERLKVVVQLLQEASKMMSRAGYLIDKANNLRG